jgi:hypothetical protein
LLCEGREATDYPPVGDRIARTHGALQRMLSTPGEPALAACPMYFCTIRRIAIAQVCQPLAIRPPKKGLLCGLGVRVERLWIELARKLDHLLLA